MKAIVTVINDLNTDQRVHRTCMLLQELGYEVTLVGRRLNSSAKMSERPYHCIRFKLLFEKGPMFYIHFNIRLFFYLLFTKSDLLFSNDLDTLAPCFVTKNIRNISLVYDSHEYFTEVPELTNRPAIQKIWKRLEKFLLKRITSLITVNQSIANLYSNQYRIKTFVVRNVPLKLHSISHSDKSKEVAQLISPHTNMIILQGSGINIDRGAEEAVMAMKLVNNATLLIIGGGDVIDQLKHLCEVNHLTKRVVFLPRMPYQEMMQYTMQASIALSLDKDTNINYRFSLPNKLFDYIQARVPVLVSNLKEVASIVNEYQIGKICNKVTPESIAECMNEMLTDTERLKHYKRQLEIAANELHWENEKNQLIKAIEYAKG
ncbi:MAG TPA: glycosyltransferase [Bacteroidia bacterium]|nr:glycosyltransferase [Bacteroidia bacterium]